MTQATQTVHSFMDLRKLAAQCDLLAASGDDAWATNRAPLPAAKAPIALGVLRLSDSGNQPAQSADEFAIVLSGRLALLHNGQTYDVHAGKSIVIPAGVAFNWTAQTATTVIVMACSSGPASTDRPIPIDENAALAPSGPPLAELLVGPTPSCRNFTDYRSTTGEFVCGTWDSTPYHRLGMTYGHFELMHLLEGAVTFIDQTGREATFGEGDVFLVEQGAHCSWESRVHAKKVYAIYRPAA